MENRYLRAIQDCVAFLMKGNRIPMVYFDGIPNVGDLMNPYLVKKITGRDVYRARTNVFPHLRAVGSVLGSASARSFIWGGGSIDGKQPGRPIDPGKIRALRGRHTLDVVRRATHLPDLDVPLGDPALLMPRYFQPGKPRGGVRVGLIPHFVDLRSELVARLARHGANLIDVRQDPESFVRQMLVCDMVYSSSLHGLILADAYGIPNKWVRIGGGVLGGSFKFSDYYSVTDSPGEEAIGLRDEDSWKMLLRDAERLTSVARYEGDLDALLEAFPAEVMDL